ncbi:benzoate 1,2-dioxygenase electron transfer component BenC [Rhizobium rhizogenes]|uniref:Toluate 1,2-dioxygenase electron transfer component n=1 Tax=Rhizobium rhizogenes (strain K84 / ATCC BAA-868) TaxID=311403 RepID=B9JQ18_RHIR8|nr:toluate 1,2-dioxygenase electron transfer component [Rhizobium rhizogenes K84]
MPKIALNFEDGVTRFVECGPNEVLVDAAYRARLNIPMDCRDGVCGTCKCRVESGFYEMDAYIEDALTDEEASQGYVLTCQMRPKSDCVLSIPATSKMCKSGPMEFGASLAEVRQLSDTTIGFTLEIDQPDNLAFLPGQYVQVSVPQTEDSRAYSFSSRLNGGRVDFLVRNIPGGLMSGYLSGRAMPGDRLTIRGPSGAFYLRELSRPTLFLAGGTGLAPFLSMLDYLSARGGSTPPIRLLYGVTRDADGVEVCKLEAFADAISNFTFEVCVSDPDSNAPRKGFVTDHFGADDLNGGDSDVYLCGPPPMVEAVRRHFDLIGVKPASFYFEKFNAAEAA